MHELWHVAVLVVVVVAAASASLLGIVPLAFETRPPGWPRMRLLLWVATALGAGLLVVEWTGVH